MNSSDLLFVLRWWGYFFVIGLIFFPLVSRIFSNFFDKGYPFAKIIGITIISYIVFVLGTVHILPFTQTTVFIVTFLCALIITVILIKSPKNNTFSIKSVIIMGFEEIFFLGGLFLWSYVRAHQPDINGLEKYMDFGFVNSISRSTYFPPKDMWYAPLPINYYYFGHLITAVITKLSGIPSYISFNLMLATIFGFTFTLSFSIAGNIWSKFSSLRLASLAQGKNPIFPFIFSGFLGGFLVTLSGNLHTIYTLFKPYQNDSPVPFWQLPFSPNTFPNSYWYPNATRFIFHTIHEFPSYSFVVSDLHGHVLDIPLVLTTIALLFAISTKLQNTNHKQISNKKISSSKGFIWKLNNWNLFGDLGFRIWDLLLISFLLATMYMTNAWDGMIYFLLSAGILFYKLRKQTTNYLLFTIYYLLFLLGLFFIFTLPFSLFFNPGALVGGIGFICSPQFLVKIGKIGPFIFEPNQCMHSPLWQLLILYGFFFFWLMSFIFILNKERKKLTISDVFVAVCSLAALFLIIIPEFFYLRDIYTTYFRANTMFKLVYQAFIIFSICISYMILRFVYVFKNKKIPFIKKLFLLPYTVVGLYFLFLVGSYSYFSVFSYYNNLLNYKGLNGINYLSNSYSSDAVAISWIQVNVKGQPVILEAQGDSYTEYARVSANTGLPTVLGWPVHEWLWRGTYDIVPPRSTDIQTMYETRSLQAFTALAKKYNVKYVFVGQLERTKYPLLYETKFYQAGRLVFRKGITSIYLLYL